MIKVTLGEGKTQEEKRFPKLMVINKGEKNAGTIVLFESIDKGTVIYGTNTHLQNVGKRFEAWCMGLFTDYNEPITLQNA